MNLQGLEAQDLGPSLVLDLVAIAVVFASGKHQVGNGLRCDLPLM